MLLQRKALFRYAPMRSLLLNRTAVFSYAPERSLLPKMKTVRSLFSKNGCFQSHSWEVVLRGRLFSVTLLGGRCSQRQAGFQLNFRDGDYCYGKRKPFSITFESRETVNITKRNLFLVAEIVHESTLKMSVTVAPRLAIVRV